MGPLAFKTNPPWGASEKASNYRRLVLGSFRGLWQPIFGRRARTRLRRVR